MAIEQIDPKTAFERMQKDPEAIFLDVRTVEEFAAGHPKGAKNIPVMLKDARSGQMLPNQDFNSVVEKLLPKDQAIYCSCRSGQRSLMAAMAMEQLGFRTLINIKGGFGGNDTTTGWKDSELPVSTDNSEPVSYEGLLAQVKKS